MATYVLVPGAWSGGWQWKAVGKVMEAAGHDVYRPTLTGLGERVHLANPDVDMDTHIQDLVNLLEYEQLTDVILVGYSYAGFVVTGVADAVPQRLKELVYFDSVVPKDGESFADLFGSEFVEALAGAAKSYGDGWRVPNNPSDPHPTTPHPLKTIYYRVAVQNPQAAALPRTFIDCTIRMGDPVLAPVHAAAKHAQSDPKWRYRQIAAEHGSVWETHVQETAELLMSLA
jgi:pimeloyl-ACP methyl ester carboxylesterase